MKNVWYRYSMKWKKGNAKIRCLGTLISEWPSRFSKSCRQHLGTGIFGNKVVNNLNKVGQSMPKRIKFVEERIASRFIAHLARLCSQCCYPDLFSPISSLSSFSFWAGWYFSFLSSGIQTLDPPHQCRLELVWIAFLSKKINIVRENYFKESVSKGQDYTRSPLHLLLCANFQTKHFSQYI